MDLIDFDNEDSSGSDFDEDEDPDKIEVPGKHNIYLYYNTGPTYSNFRFYPHKIRFYSHL